MPLARPVLLLAFALALIAAPAYRAAAQQAPSPAPSPSATDSSAAGTSETPAAAQESPPPMPPPVPSADEPKMHKLAVQQFLSWQAGTVDRTAYADDVNTQLNDEMLDRATRVLARLGGLQDVSFRGISHPKGLNVYVYHMQCERGSVDMEFAVQPDGKIALIFFD